MQQDNTVIVEHKGPVAIITLNRPKVRNAFNAEMRTRLLAAVTAINDDTSVRIAVLKGAGEGFCAGADLAEGMPDSVTDMIENEYKPFLMAIADSEKIWIASVHGAAAGIGGSLALACDLVVMAEDASIYMAFAAIGLIPDGGATWQLLNAMGYHRALEAVIEGRRIPAAECEALGLANRLAPPDEVHEIAYRWAHALSSGAPLAQAAAKRVLRHVGRMRLQDAITLEAKAQQKLVASADFRNAVAAFFDKRKPEFEGR